MIVPDLFNSEDLSNCYIIRSMAFGKDWKIYYLVWLCPETIVVPILKTMMMFQTGMCFSVRLNHIQVDFDKVNQL